MSHELIYRGDIWNRLTAAMDLLDDTALALMEFESNNFGSVLTGESYLRFYGTMQAIVLQQDAIATVFEALTDSKFAPANLSSWNGIRRFRNLATGHPLNKRGEPDAGELRTFVSRGDMQPNCVVVLSFEEKTGEGKFERYPLRDQYESYKEEAIQVLNLVRETQDRRWPPDAA